MKTLAARKTERRQIGALGRNMEYSRKAGAWGCDDLGAAAPLDVRNRTQFSVRRRNPPAMLHCLLGLRRDPLSGAG